jgi:copper(I)-binding protein
VVIPLPLKSVREMAQKLAEVAEGDSVNLEISFAKGKGVTLDFKYSAEGKAAEVKD